MSLKLAWFSLTAILSDIIFTSVKPEMKNIVAAQLMLIVFKVHAYFLSVPRSLVVFADCG